MSDRRKRAANCVAALVAVAPLLAAPPANGQFATAADGLPPGVERLCGGAIAPDLPPGMARHAARAGDELPPLPEWCDGTCTIDIAFFYAPEAIGQTRGDDPDAENPAEPRGPQTVGELREYIGAAISVANLVFQRAGLDAELRFVGMERDPGLSGLGAGESVTHVGRERLAHARSSYGADLIYAIGDYSGVCGAGSFRRSGVAPELAARSAATGSVAVGCAGIEVDREGVGLILVHEVGHNLGLLHQPEIEVEPPFVPFGHGYEGTSKHGEQSYGSIMAYAPQVHWLSTTDHLVYGRVLGDPEVSDAVRALRYTIPDATRYSPTVVPHRDEEDPHGYGCRPSDGRARLNERRFALSARYSTPAVSGKYAKRLDVYGLGDSGALFYFFGPDNPEMLIKVVNGCWLNDHWWVFGSAATDLRYEIAIEDLASSGKAVEYRHNGNGVIVADNAYSTGSGAIADTSAFPCGGGTKTARQAGESRYEGWSEVLAEVQFDQGTDVRAVLLEQGIDDPSDYGCWQRFNNVCLNNWRFGVLTLLRDRNGSRRWVPNLETYGLGGSGALFYFFGPDNPEMLIKVVNGCPINGYWWVFGSAATDLRYEVLIRDYATDRQVWYRHEGGGRIIGPNGYSTSAGVINDTTPFPCNQ